MKKYYFLIGCLLVLCMAFGPLIFIRPQQGSKPEQKDGPQFVLKDESTGEIFSITEKEYVLGALATEMPASFHPQALRAQAVACYTYAKRAQQMQPEEQKKEPIFSVNPSDMRGYATKERLQQQWDGNFSSYYTAIQQAVDEVFGQLLLYEDKPALTSYYAISSGKTEDCVNVWGQSLPYLVPVESPGDLLAKDYQSTKNISDTECESVLKAEYPDIALPAEKENWFTEPSYSDSGTLLHVKCGGKDITGQQIRKLFDLRSAFVNIYYSGSGFTFSVKGYGHGVGMSQNGADFMARQGKTYEEILAHYYPGTSLKKG